MNDFNENYWSPIGTRQEGPGEYWLCILSRSSIFKIQIENKVLKCFFPGAWERL